MAAFTFRKTAVLLVTIAVAWITFRLCSANQTKTQQAIAALEQAGGVFLYTKDKPHEPIELTFAEHLAGDLDLVQLKHLPSLETLDFNGIRRVTDAGFANIRWLPNLRTLNLGGTRISDDGLANVSNLGKLETLHLWLTTITDDGLEHVAKLPNLRMLNLWDAQISDEGLKHLQKMKSLRRLCVGRSIEQRRPILLKPLEGLSDLRLPEITDEGVAKLRKALPKTKVFYWTASEDRAGDEVAAKTQSTIERIQRESKKVEPRRVPDLGTRKHGVDWARFLGPTGDNKSPETGILTDWPDEGPRVVWQREIGDSHGVCAVSRGRLFFFDRHLDNARVVCLGSETGDELWKFEAPTSFVDQIGYGNGPRCTPVVDDDRVYAYGADGMLYCLSVLDGSELWRVDTAKQFNVVQYFFGVGSTPVVEEDPLIVVVGGSPVSDDDGHVNLNDLAGNGSGIVAFDKYTGEVVYSLTDALASYASPKMETIDDRRWCFVFARGELIGFEPLTPELDFQFAWKAKFKAAVSAATPVVVGDEVFVSEAYGPGSCLLKVRPGGCEVVWQDDPAHRDKAMQTHWNTPIYHEGFLYACSGRYATQGQVRCIEWKTGRITWSQPGLARSSLLYVDGHFIALGEYGEMQLIKANPENFELVDGVTLKEDPDQEDSPPLLKYPAWAAPVLSHGLLYVRGKDRLVCLELRSN